MLTGGASATYGSDAIAGVINFIMKKNFEGFQVDGSFGGNWHDNHSSYTQQAQRDVGDTPLTGESTDGQTMAINILAGTSLADGRGNVTAYFGYMKTDPVTSSDRDFGGCQLNPDDDLDGRALRRQPATPTTGSRRPVRTPSTNTACWATASSTSVRRKPRRPRSSIRSRTSTCSAATSATPRDSWVIWT